MTDGLVSKLLSDVLEEQESLTVAEPGLIEVEKLVFLGSCEIVSYTPGQDGVTRIQSISADLLRETGETFVDGSIFIARVGRELTLANNLLVQVDQMLKLMADGGKRLIEILISVDVEYLSPIGLGSAWSHGVDGRNIAEKIRTQRF